jgi:membrane-bound ClpP family serine protease
MNDTYMGSTKTGMDWSSFNWWGLFLLMMGVAWLGEEVGWWTFNWSMVGPLALVFAGLMLFIGRGGRK